MSAILIILSMILHRIILEYRKSALIDRWYKHSGYSAVIIGFFLCFSIGGDFIFRGVYQLEDAITTVLCFLSGILMIISGIITIHEVKERTEQVDHEK
jgi:glucose uptake protein GlcU